MKRKILVFAFLCFSGCIKQLACTDLSDEVERCDKYDETYCKTSTITALNEQDRTERTGLCTANTRQREQAYGEFNRLCR